MDRMTRWCVSENRMVLPAVRFTLGKGVYNTITNIASSVIIRTNGAVKMPAGTNAFTAGVRIKTIFLLLGLGITRRK